MKLRFKIVWSQGTKARRSSLVLNMRKKRLAGNIILEVIWRAQLRKLSGEWWDGEMERFTSQTVRRPGLIVQVNRRRYAAMQEGQLAGQRSHRAQVSVSWGAAVRFGRLEAGE